MIRVGVLSLQGDVSEHISHAKKAAEELGIECEVVEVKTKEAIRGLSALIIPGGESTTIGKLIHKYGLAEDIKKLAAEGKPIMGTCAGLIMLAEDKNGVGSLGLMDVRAARNVFGRQRESFEAELEIPALGEKPYHTVFIRAPCIEKAGRKTEVLAEYGGKTVMARQNNLLAVAFHPELTEDLRLYKYFLSSLKK